TSPRPGFRRRSPTPERPPSAPRPVAGERRICPSSSRSTRVLGARGAAPAAPQRPLRWRRLPDRRSSLCRSRPAGSRRRGRETGASRLLLRPQEVLDPDAQLALHVDELAAGDDAAGDAQGGELAQTLPRPEHVAWLELRPLSRRQTDAAELDPDDDRGIEDGRVQRLTIGRTRWACHGCLFLDQ